MYYETLSQYVLNRFVLSSSVHFITLDNIICVNEDTIHTTTHKTTRRGFLILKKASAVAVGSTALGLSLQRSVHAAGGKEIRFGLIGCGGRGSGAAGNAMNSGKDVKLVLKQANVDG